MKAMLAELAQRLGLRKDIGVDASLLASLNVLKNEAKLLEDSFIFLDTEKRAALLVKVSWAHFTLNSELECLDRLGHDLRDVLNGLRRGITTHASRDIIRWLRTYFTPCADELKTRFFTLSQSLKKLRSDEVKGRCANLSELLQNLRLQAEPTS